MFLSVIAALAILSNATFLVLLLWQFHAEIVICWNHNRQEMWIPVMLIVTPVVSIVSLVMYAVKAS